MPFDGQAFGEEIVGIVRGYVDDAVGPLRAELDAAKAKIAELEKRPVAEKGERGEPGEKGADGRDGSDGRDGANGKDAAGIVEALKHEGELVLTLEDGRLVKTGIRDGERGENGRDGFSLKNFDTEIAEDGRTLTLIFEDEGLEYRHEMRFAVPLYRGVWTEGEYCSGDCVTWGGSVWIAQRDTSGKPDAPESGWRLAVKKGRDGKDAKNG